MGNQVIWELNERRAVILSVQCIYDNPLLEPWEAMSYEIPIQAGAALTEQRIAPLTDMDGDDGDHISDRNRRYSELTAMYWAWKHLNTPYIGICHYRRKFDLTQQELEHYMDSGADVVILQEVMLEESIENGYAAYHYIYDWIYILELIRLQDEGFYHFIVDNEHRSLHGACMAIYKKSYFDEVCSFLFPILDRFYRERPEKRDVYQRRDVGFLAERLLSLYFEYRKESLQYATVGLRSLASAQDVKELADEKQMSDPDTVRMAVETYLSKNQFTKCAMLLCSMPQLNEELFTLCKLVKVFVNERSKESETFYDYMEGESTIENLVSFYENVVTELRSLMKAGLTQENLTKLLNRMRITPTALLTIMELEKIGSC